MKSELKQRPCWIVYTNSEVHQILREGLPESPLYNGQIKSIGPRYCPSIETKLVTFPDKEQHQLFLEPEGESTHEMYLNGFSSSMPWKVQFEALSKIPAFENVQAYRPGYAIEYDFFDPTQLHHNLETKLVKNLFSQVKSTVPLVMKRPLGRGWWLVSTPIKPWQGANLSCLAVMRPTSVCLSTTS